MSQIKPWMWWVIVAAVLFWLLEREKSRPMVPGAGSFTTAPGGDLFIPGTPDPANDPNSFWEPAPGGGSDSYTVTGGNPANPVPPFFSDNGGVRPVGSPTTPFIPSGITVPGGVSGGTGGAPTGSTAPPPPTTGTVAGVPHHYPAPRGTPGPHSRYELP